MHWDSIKRQALLGASRRAEPEKVESESIIEPGEIASQAAKLLIQAGAIAQYDAAGHELPTLPAEWLTPPPSVDPRPPCPADASDALAAILNGAQHRELLPEFLDQMEKAGLRVPDYLLPSLLKAGHRSPRLQAPIVRSLGPKGRWLARFGHQEWDYATLNLNDWEDLLRRYRSGKISKRVSLLKLLRDLDPAVGRALIHATWKSEGDLHRPQLLATLSVRLSREDETLLESALQDRTLTVRRKAADLLQKLPRSTYSERMLGYLGEVVQFKKRLVHKPTLVVAFPKEPSPSMLRDGIEHPSNRKRGNQKWYIRDMMTMIVQSTPISAWESLFGLSKRDILDAVRESGWPRTFTLGIYRSTVNQKDQAWARQLIEQEQKERWVTQAKLNLGRLVTVLDPTEAMLTFNQLHEEWGPFEMTRHNPLRDFWKEWTHPWEPEFTEKTADILLRQLHLISDGERLDATTTSAFKKFLKTCPVAHADLVRSVFDDPSLSARKQKSLATWLDVLRFRERVNHALSSDPSIEDKRKQIK